MNLKLKKPKRPNFSKKSKAEVGSKLKSKNSSKTSSVEENLRPESRLVRALNRATEKASDVGAKEVSTPTPKKGILGKRVNPFAPLIWLLRYIRDSYRELKKVTWLDRKSAWKLTATVFFFSALMALILFGLDSLFGKMFEIVFLQD
jgi:preprotein translocase SecE subunit